MLTEKILNRIRYLYLLRRIKKYRALTSIPPFRDVTAARVQANMKRLQPLYEEYVSTISTPEMAASLRMLAFLLSLIEVGQYNRIADIGSGLSSLVLRWGSKGSPLAQVVSVDDSQEWLEKTRGFLRRHDVDCDQCVTLEDFLENRPSGFDLIFFDLNLVEVRIKYVEEIFAALHSGGIMIFDDVHKRDYLFPLLEILVNHGVSLYSLKPATLDEFGRFAVLAVRE